jgi:hypothetical protein
LNSSPTPFPYKYFSVKLQNCPNAAIRVSVSLRHNCKTAKPQNCKTKFRLLYLPECINVFANIILPRAGFVLHNVPGMLQGNYFFEEAVTFIQCTKEFLIFPGSETKTNIRLDAKFDLIPDAINNEIEYGIR